MSGSTLAAKATRAVRSLSTDVVDAARAWSPVAQANADALAPRPEDVDDPRLASAALLIEVAHADGRFSSREHRIVEDTLRSEFGLDRARASRLAHAAARLRDAAVGPWVFTNVLVEAFSGQQRRNLVQILHRLADVDGASSWRVNYVIGQLSSLLRVESPLV